MESPPSGVPEPLNEDFVVFDATLQSGQRDGYEYKDSHITCLMAPRGRIQFKFQHIGVDTTNAENVQEVILAAIDKYASEEEDYVRDVKVEETFVTIKVKLALDVCQELRLACYMRWSQQLQHRVLAELQGDKSLLASVYKAGTKTLDENLFLKRFAEPENMTGRLEYLGYVPKELREIAVLDLFNKIKTHGPENYHLPRQFQLPVSPEMWNSTDPQYSAIFDSHAMKDSESLPETIHGVSYLVHDNSGVYTFRTLRPSKHKYKRCKEDRIGFVFPSVNDSLYVLSLDGRVVRGVNYLESLGEFVGNEAGAEARIVEISRRHKNDLLMNFSIIVYPAWEYNKSDIRGLDLFSQHCLNEFNMGKLINRVINTGAPFYNKSTTFIELDEPVFSICANCWCPLTTTAPDLFYCSLEGLYVDITANNCTNLVTRVATLLSEYGQGALSKEGGKKLPFRIFKVLGTEERERESA